MTEDGYEATYEPEDVCESGEPHNTDTVYEGSDTDAAGVYEEESYMQEEEPAEE